MKVHKDIRQNSQRHSILDLIKVLLQINVSTDEQHNSHEAAVLKAAGTTPLPGIGRTQSRENRNGSVCQITTHPNPGESRREPIKWRKYNHF